MVQDQSFPAGWFEEGARALLVEAPAGEQRRGFLSDRLRQAAEAGARTWKVDCSFSEIGPWAGMREIFASLIDDLRNGKPDLLEKHDYELIHVLPEVQTWLKAKNPNLTDLAPKEEKVRNYPADRAFRVVHGLIDLLVDWRGPGDDRPWVIACDRADGMSHIARRFFCQLLRRRGRALRLTLLCAVEPGQGQRVGAELGQPGARVLPLALLPDEPLPIDIEGVSAAARALEAAAGSDRLQAQIHSAELIHLWHLAGREDKALRWEVLALDIYNTLGLYEDARIYGERARALAREHAAGEELMHWAIFLKLFMCYLGLQEVELAHRLLLEDVFEKVVDPERLAQVYYLMAMLHGRYLPQRDFGKAEEYLDKGMDLLHRGAITPDTLHFRIAFNRNGLAMVRHFQGFPEEALELCRASYREIQDNLPPDKHRLHRSVLLYNIAQVCAMIGRSEDALEMYSAAMEIDPKYSEYYNERGNVYLRLRRLQEARGDYLRAIELSPPYYEAYANLGQCCRLLGYHDEALAAYSKAVDLEPDHPLSFLGRAEVFQAQAHLQEAIADYTAALALNPEDWRALANRAILFYESGDLASSLTDLDGAIQLAPGVADLYSNRAIALTDLGRCEQAIEDLRACIELDPDAGELSEREMRLHGLLLQQQARPSTTYNPETLIRGEA
jgi:tetratricopeptide (TPR) repeat protein